MMFMLFMREIRVRCYGVMPPGDVFFLVGIGGEADISIWVFYLAISGKLQPHKKDMTADEIDRAA